jgi:hypothetical protein
MVKIHNKNIVNNHQTPWQQIIKNRAQIIKHQPLASLLLVLANTSRSSAGPIWPMIAEYDLQIHVGFVMCNRCLSEPDDSCNFHQNA